MEKTGQLKMCFWQFLLMLLVFTSTYANVILSATDGSVSVPGGYVVPLNGSLTLKCHATRYNSKAPLRWNITLNGRTSVGGNTGTVFGSNKQKYSVPDSKDNLTKDNPTFLGVRHLQLIENGSTIQCGVPNVNGSYIASSQAQVVFVEGAPLCPKVNITNTANTMNCILIWKLDGHVLLPITYMIFVRMINGEIVFSQNTSRTQIKLTGQGIQTLTNYTVTVVACTRAGCSQNCDNTQFISIPPKVPKPGADTQGTAVSSSVPPGNTGVIVAVVLCIVAGIGILVVVVIVSWCIVWKWKSQKDKCTAIQHSVDEIAPKQTLKNDGVLEEYATVTDVVKNHHLHTPSDKNIPHSCSHHNNVTDTEGYGTIQNAATSPQKVRSESSFKLKPDIPISSEYALVNHNTNNQTFTHVGPIVHGTRHSLAGPIAVPSEYAQVPDSIKMKPPLQRTQSIPTPSSVSDGTFLPAPPPLPPRGSELSPESPDVIDAGYASLPHNSKSGKITKVRPSKRGSSRDVQV